MTRISRAISNTVSFSPSRAIETFPHMDLASGGGGGGTSTFTVSAGADDGYVAKSTSSSSVPTSGWGSPSNSGASMVVGIQEDYENWPNYLDHFMGYVRFQNVTIAQGATIVSAYLKPYVQAGAERTWAVKGFDKDNVSAPSSGSDLAHSNLTTAGITNFVVSSGASRKTSPDIKTIVQEIVNRSSWASGNSMMFAMWLHSYSTGTEIRNPRTFEHSSASQACQLEITT